MNKLVKTENEIKQKKRLIYVLSVLIPLIVIALFSIKIKGYNFSFLPPIYSSVNALTSVILIFALYAVKTKKLKLHEKLMKSCFILSMLFFIMYITYHITSESTHYGGTGILKIIYYLILISHILLSVVVIPFVLFTYFYAWKGDFIAHKKIAKFVWPIWFYVCTSGVFVYLMISPYYT